MSDVRAVTTAFLVVQHADGRWEALSDIDTPVTLDHPAALSEMRTGAAQVAFEIGCNITASLVVQQQLAYAQMAQRAAADENLKRKLVVP